MSSMDFNYQQTYIDNLGKKHQIKTQAYIKPYNEEVLFDLPLFQFSNSFASDYRNVGVAEYDKLFWNMNKEFSFNDKIEKRQKFIKEYNIADTIQTLSLSRSDDKPSGLFEYAYIRWSHKRLIIKEAPPKEISDASIKYIYKSDRYNINVKLYLDYNEINDTAFYSLYSIIDPAETFYYFPVNNLSHCFINMHLDLLEIEKRKLEKKINKLDTLNFEVVKKLYDESVIATDVIIKDFHKQVSRGDNKSAMERWNTIIFEELQIDNIKLFEPYSKEE